MVIKHSPMRNLPIKCRDKQILCREDALDQIKRERLDAMVMRGCNCHDMREVAVAQQTLHKLMYCVISGLGISRVASRICSSATIARQKCRPQNYDQRTRKNYEHC